MYIVRVHVAPVFRRYGTLTASKHQPMPSTPPAGLRARVAQQRSVYKSTRSTVSRAASDGGEGCAAMHESEQEEERSEPQGEQRPEPQGEQRSAPLGEERSEPRSVPQREQRSASQLQQGRYEKLAKAAAGSAPPALAPYIEKLAPVVGAVAGVCPPSLWPRWGRAGALRYVMWVLQGRTAGQVR